MTGAVALLFIVVSTGQACAEDTDTTLPFHRAPEEFLRLLEPLPPSHAAVAERFSKTLTRLKRRELGLRPLFMLVPTEPEEDGENKPPTFALVARAKGRTLVSLTRPGGKANPRDRVLFQRLLVSDLLRGRRFSLTVYKDHAIDEHALRFLGVGARLMIRPQLKLRDWRLGFQLLASYHPDYGGTGYLSISGRRTAPSTVGSLPVE